MNENEQARLDRVTQGKMSAMETEQRRSARACAQEVAQHGLAPDSDVMRRCAGGVDPADRGALANVDLAERLALQFWLAALSEEDNVVAAQDQLRAARTSFGDLPLVVLVRGVSPFGFPGRPPSAMNMAVEAENLAMQQAVARLSTHGSWRIVDGAGHLIQQDRPEAVARAVDALLAQMPH